MNKVSGHFKDNAEPAYGSAEHFNTAYDRMFTAIQDICKDALTIDAVESDVANIFRQFLKDMGYKIAERNFNALLEEKNGNKKQRNDGTTGWYHEFIPILHILALTRMGRDNGGIDYNSFKRYGGLEVFISSHLRHDSIEDSKETGIRKKATRFRDSLFEMYKEICKADPDFDTRQNQDKTRRIIIYTNLMSQKLIRSDQGTIKKEPPLRYLNRLVGSKKANPITMMGKLGDIGHNLSTLLGSPKYNDPQKRLDLCNKREDQFGPRHGFTDIARHKWPEFSKAINTLDCIIGTILYPHFRYLETVDEAYKEPSPYPVGIFRYIGTAMKVVMPDPRFHMVHIAFQRLQNSVDLQQDPKKHQRLKNFLETVLKPALRGHEDKFPYLFPPSRVPTNDNRLKGWHV